MSWLNDAFVTKDGDIITIHSLQTANAVDDFVKQIRKGHLREGYEQLTINLTNQYRVFSLMLRYQLPVL